MSQECGSCGNSSDLNSDQEQALKIDKGNLSQLEETIIHMVRHEFQLLESFTKSKDTDDALSAWLRLTGIIPLAHIKDSGLSDETSMLILDVESKAAQLISN